MMPRTVSFPFTAGTEEIRFLSRMCSTCSAVSSIRTAQTFFSMMEDTGWGRSVLSAGMVAAGQGVSK